MARSKSIRRWGANAPETICRAREVVNVNPTVANPNHTTLVTGVLPAAYGVYNDRPFEPSEKGAKGYSDYAEIKAPPLWGAAKAAG